MLSTRLEHLSQAIEQWRHPNGLYKVMALLVVGILCGAIGLVVYQQGGTQSVYPHLMYLPVLLAAFYFKGLGGLTAGIVAGLVLGPFMPLNVAAEIPQSPLNWLIRTGFFVLVGLVAGLGFRLLNVQLDWLSKQAYYDPLTRLPNLTALRKHLHSLQPQKDQAPSSHQLMVFNIANQTEIVNTLGYRKTDQLIRQLAHWLQQTLSQASLVARVHSDMFAAVLPHSSSEYASTLLTTFAHLRETGILGKELPIHVEASIGIVHLAKITEGPDASISLAKIAAKNAYTEGTGIAEYAGDQGNKIKETLKLLGELRKAIEEDQLVLYYQPKLDLTSGRITGIEALIRWQHPQWGYIPPDQFIPIAERTTLIKPLTRWVLKTALRQLAQWQEAGLNLEMAVNLSARNLDEGDFLNEIVKLLETYRICPGQLTLEITESALTHPASDTVHSLGTLRARGVKIAIDDFGTGYSCLAYLKQLPVDSVKIDRSFIRQLQDDNQDRVIVQTIIDFSHHFNLDVVAEGVETQEILNLLGAMGCDRVQGYFVGRPVPAPEINQCYIEEREASTSASLAKKPLIRPFAGDLRYCQESCKRIPAFNP